MSINNLWSTSNLLEMMNLYLALIDMVALSIFGIYLFKIPTGYRGPSAQLAIALSIYIAGHMFTRLWTWFLSFHGDGSTGTKAPVLIVTITITTIGLIWTMTLLSSFVVGKVVWPITVVTALLISIGVTWFL